MSRGLINTTFFDRIDDEDEDDDDDEDEDAPATTPAGNKNGE